MQAAADPAERAGAKSRLRQALEPPRLRLLTQFGAIPDGVRFLVELRAFLMRAAVEDATLAALEADLHGPAAPLVRPRLPGTAAGSTGRARRSLLEKLVGYEAVHEIRGWRDLKNRLDSDRRCYAFFHPRMPDEPLIFVEVALVKGIAGFACRRCSTTTPRCSIPAQADTAIFYSISNCQRGLAGISFGNFLIKRVVDLLSAEFPNLRPSPR